MFAYLLLLFILLPVAEFYLLLVMADHVGAFWTFSLVVFTGVLGAWLCRLQGFRTFTRIQQQIGGGQMPTNSLMDGGMILVAAALLVTPGVMTDLFGFSLLFPPCRAIYRKLIARSMKGKFKFQAYTATGANDDAFRHWGGTVDKNVVDGEVVQEREADSRHETR